MFNLNSHKTALLFENIKFKYFEFKDLKKSFSKLINKQTLILCLSDNSLASVAGYVCFLDNKYSQILLDRNSPNHFYKNIIDRYKPDFIWAPNEKINQFLEFSKIFSFQKYSLLKSKSVIKKKIESNIAVLLSTSGSTGSEKFVKLSFENLYSNATSISNYLKLDYNDRSITNLPINYSYGLSVINSHLLSEGSLVLTNLSIFSKEFWILFNERKVTNFNGVPYSYDIISKLRFKVFKSSSIRFITQAGGAISKTMHANILEFCTKNKIDFFAMYGQTEATARISYLPPSNSINKIGSIGIPIPAGKLEVWDENEKKISKCNVSGELVYFGKNIMLGYSSSFEDLSINNEAVYLKTGDLGYFDNDGYFFVNGRKKRIIKITGIRINLDELQKKIQDYVKNENIYLTGKDNNLVIVLTCNKLEFDVKKYLQEIKINKLMYRFVVLKDIPRKKNGKIDFIKLKSISEN
jgi:long-subunit acyl-CoA synthetase (AMP-forming)